MVKINSVGGLTNLGELRHVVRSLTNLKVANCVEFKLKVAEFDVRARRIGAVTESVQEQFKGRRRLVSLGVVALAIVAGVIASPAFGKSPLGKKWGRAELVSMDDIDHSSFDKLLKKYVDRDGYVDYFAWQRSRADRSSLQNYLSMLSRATPSKKASKDAQLAFWINAYNAVTLEGIMQVYPTSSIRKHTAKLFGYNIWQDLPLWVGDNKYSLENIEHKVLRKMKEPRIHFAIVCASVGCPRLRNEAYFAKRLEKQLADNSKDFFSRSQNFRMNGNRLYVSSILKWFASDFGASQAARFQYLQPYLPDAAKQVAVQSGTRISYLDYDWLLNDQRKK